MSSGSIGWNLSQNALSDRQSEIYKLVDDEFKKYGKIKLRLKVHFKYYPKDRVYFYDVIHVKTDRVVYKIWA